MHGHGIRACQTCLRSRNILRHPRLTYLPGLLVLGSASIAGAVGNEPVAFHETGVLGTSMDLLVNTPSKESADKVRSAVLDEIARLSKVLSTYDPSSDAARLNATREPVKVGPELIEVLG